MTAATSNHSGVLIEYDALRADAVLGRASGENFPVAARILPSRMRDDILAVYGIEMSREKVDQDFNSISAIDDDRTTMRVLEEESPRRRKLKVVG